MKFHLMKAAALAGAIAMALPVMGQDAQSSGSVQQTTLNDNGGFSINLRNQKISPQQLEKALPAMLGLSSQNTLKETKRNEDNFGIIHIAYQQYFKGIPVQDGLVLAHIKNGLVTSVNGTILAIPDEFPMPAQRITAEKALAIAQKVMGVSGLIKKYPAELVMMKNKTGENSAFVLAWKVRVDGKNEDGKISMDRVYLNAATGDLVNSISLINDADVTANAETLYRGQKQITADSYNGKYRLKDNARKIYTYNAGGVEPSSSWTATSPFVEDVDYINATTDWDEVKTLQTIVITALGNAGFIGGVGQNAVLIAAVGHGTATSIDDANLLSMNILYSANTLPVTATGLQVQVEDDSLFGAFAKVDFSTGDVVDSMAFPMPDTTLGTHNWSDTAGNQGTYFLEMAKNPALDAHWGMEMTHDFYLNELNRNSYDGNGGAVKNYINGTLTLLGTQNNAAALSAPYNSMIYGLGDGVSMGPVVGLDVMGHEFSHMVTGNNGHGGLNYQNESGALNESFSDMMGTAIEFYADSANANWTIGEGVVLQSPFYMRSMSEPNGPTIAPGFQRQPDTYLGDYWYSGNQDNGGVHVNSGVPNKWFYLLSEGGSGTNDNSYQYNVTGQGIDKAAKIAYQTLTQYLTPSATFVDAYNGSLNAAEDLYGANSSEYEAVKEAWLAVGVPNNDDTTGINTVLSENEFVKIYPNPATTKVNIQSTWNQPLEVAIFSIAGAKVRTVVVKPGHNSLSVAGLSRGTYLLKYELNQQAYAEKLTLR